MWGGGGGARGSYLAHGLLVPRYKGHQRVWRRPGERHAQCCIRQHDGLGGIGVMVWASIRNDLCLI